MGIFEERIDTSIGLCRVTATTHTLGSLLISACGLVHNVLLGLIGTSRITAEFSAEATSGAIVIIVSVTAATAIVIIAISRIVTSITVTVSGRITAEFPTEATGSAIVIIVTISARAAIVIVIITATTATTTAIETIISSATDGATRAITFGSASFSGAHTRDIGQPRLIGLCQQEAGRVRARQ